MVANALTAAYLLAYFAPLGMASLTPHRHEQQAVVVPSMVMGAACAIVCSVPFLPVNNSIE
jgi:hypothetical protein